MSWPVCFTRSCDVPSLLLVCVSFRRFDAPLGKTTPAARRKKLVRGRCHIRKVVPESTATDGGFTVTSCPQSPSPRRHLMSTLCSTALFCLLSTARFQDVEHTFFRRKVHHGLVFVQRVWPGLQGPQLLRHEALKATGVKGFRVAMRNRPMASDVRDFCGERA